MALTDPRTDPPGAPPHWLDELPLKAGPPWHTMGVRALDLSQWLVVDDQLDEQLALKQRLSAERHDDVFLARPGTEAAGAETLALIQAWLTTHRGVPNTPTPEPRDGVDLHPLDQAGRLVQEDLCLMAPDGGHHVLVAGSVCFPSHWRLADKLGRSVAEIHGPVPHYADELADKVDRFFDRLTVEHPVVRRNLSIHSHDELFRPEPHESPDSFAPDARGVDQVWLRSERQTLVVLPASGAVLFTIKTQQCPASALAARPDIAHALAAKLTALTPDLTATGEPIPFPPWLVDWLQSL